jgi:hypothetical protein
MSMTQYIMAVKRGLRDQHGFTPSGGTEQDPTFGPVPDGVYPMTIDGKVDYVKIEDGGISCCNFDAAKPNEPNEPKG